MTISWYRQGLGNAYGGASAPGAPNVDYLSDDIRLALIANTYTPNLDTHDYWDDVVANEISGTGYTANGQALGSRTLTYTAANSWSPAWASATAYVLNALVRPTTGNGFVYRATTPGTSGGAEPTWPTVIGQTVVDGGVTWVCEGRGVWVFDAADPSWAGASFTARYGVAYDRTPASDATRPLIWLIDFGSDVTVTASTFSIVLPTTGLGYLTS